MNRVNLTLSALAIALIYLWWSPEAPLDIQEDTFEEVEIEDTEESPPLERQQPSPPPPARVAPKIAPKKNKAISLKKVKARPSKKYPNLDDTFHPFDSKGNLIVTQVTVDGEHLTFQGDQLLGETKDLEKIKKKGSLKISKPKLWPSKKIPYAMEEDLPNMAAIEEAIAYFNQYTNLNLVPRKSEKDFLYFKKGEKNCYSYVGYQGGRQPVFLSKHCGPSQISHELNHSIGFFHEQNRGDRDNFLEVDWDNIDLGHKINFKKIPLDFMHLSGEAFTFDTIMLYPSTAFASDPSSPAMLTRSGEEIAPFEGLLSSDDIRRINRVYP